MMKQKPIRRRLSSSAWGGLIAGLATLIAGVTIFGFANDWQLPAENDLEWRDILFIAFTPIAIGLAVWRSLIAENSLLQDRYQSAANMLGSDSMPTRMGGIDILQKMAEEHSKQYHIQIMYLLSAFIRNPSEAPSKKEEIDNQGKIVITDVSFPSDFKAALNAIFNRSKKQIEMEPDGWQIDFTGVPLYGLNLEAEKPDFTHIKLDNADLSNTNLTTAKGITQWELTTAKYRKGQPPLLGDARCAQSGHKLHTKHMIPYR